jgi:hypothetical protein
MSKTKSFCDYVPKSSKYQEQYSRTQRGEHSSHQLYWSWKAIKFLWWRFIWFRGYRTVSYLLRGNRLDMPKKLRSHTLNIAHAQHQGIVKTKTLLNSNKSTVAGNRSPGWNAYRFLYTLSSCKTLNRRWKWPQCNPNHGEWLMGIFVDHSPEGTIF